MMTRYMKTNTHMITARRHVAGLSALAVVLTAVLPGTALAASSWNPTLLVNTESFQTVDEGDGTTSIEIRFGQSLNEKIFYDRTNSRFVFSRSLKVNGTLTTTGAAIIGVGATSATPDAGVTLEVLGTASGMNLFIGKSMTGTHIYAAQTFAGAGLTSCTGANNKLTWNAATKQFACETDQQGTGSLFSTGSLTTAFDNRYVNVSGDTMTGSLKVRANLSGSSLTVDGNAAVYGAVAASGSVTTKADINLNSDNGNVDAIVTFGNDGGAETIRFNNTSNNFALSDDIDVTGNVDATGTVSGDGNFTINEDQTAADTVLTFGSDTLNETLTFMNTEDRFQFSDDVFVTGNISGSGTLTVDGNAATKANLTINSDNGGADAILTFGNDGGAETFRFNDTTNNFTVSDDIDVTGGVRASGNLSGSTLTVDGNVTLRGQTYILPTAQGAAGSVLKNNGAGTLTWSTSLNNSSGGVMTLQPEYDGATYYQSGSTAVGTLTQSYDATNTENYYSWTTTRGTIQDYWVSARVQVPGNFQRFESASGMILRLRTTSTSAANNHVTIRVLDTAGATVALTNNAALRSTTAATWRTLTVSGLTSGTYTPGGYITILVKVAAVTANTTDLGSIKLNWVTTTP